jgi:hypothetical protein
MAMVGEPAVVQPVVEEPALPPQSADGAARPQDPATRDHQQQDDQHAEEIIHAGGP